VWVPTAVNSDTTWVSSATWFVTVMAKSGKAVVKPRMN